MLFLQYLGLLAIHTPLCSLSFLFVFVLIVVQYSNCWLTLIYHILYQCATEASEITHPQWRHWLRSETQLTDKLHRSFLPFLWRCFATTSQTSHPVCPPLQVSSAFNNIWKHTFQQRNFRKYLVTKQQFFYDRKKLARLLFDFCIINTTYDDCERQVPSIALCLQWMTRQAARRW